MRFRQRPKIELGCFLIALAAMVMFAVAYTLLYAALLTKGLP
jgi:hypothetical protein